VKKKTLLIVHPFKFTKYYNSRYELSYLRDEYNIDIKIHEMIDFLYPNFKTAFNQNIGDLEISSYSNFKDWKKNFRKIIKDNKSNIVILSEIHVRSIKELMIAIELKRANVPIIEFRSPAGPRKKDKNIASNLFHKIKRVFKFPKNAIFYSIYNLLIYVRFFLNLYPSYVIKAGSEGLPKFYKKRKVNVIEANSYDYSNYILSSSKSKLDKINKIGFFLDSPAPKFKGDGFLFGKKNIRTEEKWFPSLNKFFDRMEKLLNIKILIVSHPKVKQEKFPSYFGGREVLEKSLNEISEETDLFITVESTAVSFGVIQKKPIFIIYSDEIKKSEVYLNNIKLIAKELGVEAINIDDPFNEKVILNNLKINHQKFSEYKNTYITTLKHKKPNYKIVGDLILTLTNRSS
jgi:hypothetical protein